MLVLATFVVLFMERPDAGVVPAHFSEGSDLIAFDAIAINGPGATGGSALDADSPSNVSATGDAVVDDECCGGSAAFEGSLSVSGTPIAEPTTLLLLGLGLAVLAWSIRRNRRK